MKEPHQLSIVQLNEEDIPGLITLSDSVGWDYDKEEIHTILSSGFIYGHKSEQGEIVSSAAVIQYDSVLASVGMVIVHNGFRRMGLANELMEKCIHTVSDRMPIMLIATEEGEPLYKKIGFTTVASVQKHLCHRFEPIPLAIEHNQSLEIYTNSDFSALHQLDRLAFGGSRETFLEKRIDQAEECILLKENNRIIGYGMAVRAPATLKIGSIVAPHSDAALLIIGKLAQNRKETLRLDIPSDQKNLSARLAPYGFQKVNEPPVMMFNGLKMPERNRTLYAIAAQIFG
ncbi:GNAT family N-acetyltransferase [Cytobacillus purgationiresistens]|nr:GNAT family N-acetyltransferase [Cytobacillus purgationiresistens]